MAEMVTGKIVTVVPSVIAPGQSLNIYVSYEAYFEGVWGFWGTKLSASLDGFADSDTQSHFGPEGRRDDEKLMLGIMPNRSVSGYVTLSKNGKTLDSRYITIGLPETMPTVTPLPPAIIAPAPAVPDEPKWYEVWKQPVEPSPSAEPFPEPVPLVAPPVEVRKETWLWVGLAVVAVIGVVFVMRK